MLSSLTDYRQVLDLDSNLKQHDIELVHISRLNINDVVILRGELVTSNVSKKNYHILDGIGYTLSGDSYNLGYEKVSRVIIPRFYKGERV